MSPSANTSDTAVAQPVIDRNSVVNIALIGASVALTFSLHPLALLLWPTALVVDDILYFSLGISMFDTEVGVQRGYQFAHIFLERISGAGRDLGSNLYDGDLTKSREQSQIDKWDFMIEQLGLRSGDRVMDIGCGYGDWIRYAKSKGMHVVGVNISPEQAAYGRDEYGLDVICTNWKDILKSEEFQERLYGKFDAVTFMDTVEHYVPGRLRNDLPAQGRVYSNMFELARRLIDPASGSGRVFVSCLHTVNRPWGLRQNLSAYLLTRYHSGFYPLGDDGLTRWTDGRFEEIARYDKTEDYRLTGVLDRAHFQAPAIQWTLRKVLFVPLLLLIDPHHLHKWIDIHYDAWMNLYGDQAWDRGYDPKKRGQLTYVKLWWLVLQRPAAAEEAAVASTG